MLETSCVNITLLSVNISLRLDSTVSFYFLKKAQPIIFLKYQDHKELQNFERQNRRILQTKGELSNERKEKQEILNQSFTKLLNMTQQFADILAEELPELRQDLSPRDEECSVLELCENMSDQACETLNELLWENEEGRQFYENLPNLSVYLPNLIPKVTVERQHF